MTKRISEWRDGLEAALKETPPPSLALILKRLGKLEQSVLNNHLPDLCRAIIDRYAQWKVSREEDVVSNLRAALKEEPPLAWEQVAARHGYVANNLRNRYPELCRMIVERYAAYRRRRAEEKRQLFREEIRRVVLDLHARGIHPSQDTVRPLLGNACLWILTECLRDLRRELGLPDADTRSLAEA